MFVYDTVYIRQTDSDRNDTEASRSAFSTEEGPEKPRSIVAKELAESAKDEARAEKRAEKKAEAERRRQERKKEASKIKTPVLRGGAPGEEEKQGGDDRGAEYREQRRKALREDRPVVVYHRRLKLLSDRIVFREAVSDVIGQAERKAGEPGKEELQKPRRKEQPEPDLDPVRLATVRRVRKRGDRKPDQPEGKYRRQDEYDPDDGSRRLQPSFPLTELLYHIGGCNATFLTNKPNRAVIGFK